MTYWVLHCGQWTLSNEFPFCFSSTQRCKHVSWTHLVVPLHWHGWTHKAVLSSSSVAKQTQQYLLLKRSSTKLNKFKFYKQTILTYHRVDQHYQLPTRLHPPCFRIYRVFFALLKSTVTSMGNASKEETTKWRITDRLQGRSKSSRIPKIEKSVFSYNQSTNV